MGGQGNENLDPSSLTLSGFSGVDNSLPSLFPCPPIPLPFPYHVRRLDFARSVTRSKGAIHDSGILSHSAAVQPHPKSSSVSREFDDEGADEDEQPPRNDRSRKRDSTRFLAILEASTALLCVLLLRVSLRRLANVRQRTECLCRLWFGRIGKHKRNV